MASNVLQIPMGNTVFNWQATIKNSAEKATEAWSRTYFASHMFPILILIRVQDIRTHPMHVPTILQASPTKLDSRKTIGPKTNPLSDMLLPLFLHGSPKNIRLKFPFTAQSYQNYVVEAFCKCSDTLSVPSRRKEPIQKPFRYNLGHN